MIVKNDFDHSMSQALSNIFKLAQHLTAIAIGILDIL